MKQVTFSDFEYSHRKRKTKRENFLEFMDSLIPWQEWSALIEPYYPAGKRGRPPLGIEKMLRMYLLQCWFNLSDEGIEDAIYDSYALRSFMGLDFLQEQVPDATTLLKFRHLLEKHEIGEKLFHFISEQLEKNGYMMRGGSIVDATIIQAPSSTKNRAHERDPEMCQTKKGSQYYFGMKAHIGVDAGSGYVHTMKTTAANVHDIVEAPFLIRDDDNVVYGDSGYRGLEKRLETRSDANKNTIEVRTTPSIGRIRKMPWGNWGWDKKIAKRNASTRAKVEHPFLIVKKTFGFCKTVYRGLFKNTNRLFVLFASANILMCGRAGRKFA